MYRNSQEEKEISKCAKLTYTMLFSTILCIIISWNAHVEFFDIEGFNKSRSYVDGILTHVDDYTIGNSQHESWVVKVKYTFKINNTKYNGNKLGYIEHPSDYYYKSTDATLDKYGLKMGNTIRVHYNINDPNQSMLFPSQGTNSKNRIYMLILAIICAIATCYCFKKYISLKKKD